MLTILALSVDEEVHESSEFLKRTLVSSNNMENTRSEDTSGGTTITFSNILRSEFCPLRSKIRKLQDTYSLLPHSAEL